MSITAQAATAPAREWVVPAVRAVVYAAVAAAITFSAVHDAALGLYAVAAGAIVPPVIEVLVRRGLPQGPERLSLLVRLIGGIVAGLLAIVLALFTPVVASFVFVVLGWGVVTGAGEAIAAILARRAGTPFDGLLPGLITVAIGIAVVLVPLNLHQQTLLDTGGTGYLDASVVSVGLFGAYGAVMAVYLAISAASVGFSRPRDAREVAAPRNEDR